MTDYEKLELALFSASEYAEFQHYCLGRTSCIGCFYRRTNICAVIGAQEFVATLGLFLKSINYKKAMKNLKPGD